MPKAWLTQKRRQMARDRRTPSPVRPDLQEPYGTWLSRFPWDWYATMTFASLIHPEEAAKRWLRWTRHVEREERHAIRWARALEYQKRGVIHYHALTWGMLDARRLTYMDAWHELAGGFARIVAYEPARGASFYLGKYIAKGGEVDLGGKWWNPAPLEREQGEEEMST
jgi:hypothetical protein